MTLLAVYNPVVVTSKDIRAWVIEQIGAGASTDVGARGATQFGITRQAMGRHLRTLLNEGLLNATGQTKARRYELAVLKSFDRIYPVNAEFQEDIIWSEDLRPLVVDRLAQNVLEICAYGVTEILNNARDHSGSGSVLVELKLTVAELKVIVHDFGIGIFRKIKEAAGLEDERHAILELVKGRFTTDPERHTGEGIFFTSRAFDSIAILAGSLNLMHNREGADWLIDDVKPITGTFVSLSIHPASTHTIKEVFDRYATEQDDYAFQRTHLLVALAQTDGGALISRSQAKRVMARCDRFREVMLDFRRVERIGPSFADEIFRVWRRAHPGVAIMPIGMSEEVERMVKRALTAETPGGPETPNGWA